MAFKQPISEQAIPPAFDSPHESGCLDTLKERILTASSIDDCWPRRSVSSSDGKQIIQVFRNHKNWYEAVKIRVCRRGWNPEQLRVVCLDRVDAARIASWLRKAQYPKRSADWVCGEYVRILDPIVNGAGETLQPADCEYKITLVRSISFGDSRGILHWTTPAKQQPRQLDISIPPMDLLAVQLQPLGGGRPVAALTERPGANTWHNTCREFRTSIVGAKHQNEIFDQGSRWIEELQRQVVRLRPAVAIPAEKFSDTSCTAVALDSEMTRAYGDQDKDLLRRVVAATQNELLLCRQPIDELN